MILKLIPTGLLMISVLAAAKVPDPSVGLHADKSWRTYQSAQILFEPSMNFPYQHCFERASKMHDVPLTLLLAMARGESNFDPAAVSSADAVGLMQIQWPGTAKHLGIHERAKLFDPCTNVEAGTRYFRELMDRFNQDIHVSLAAYNYGPTAIAKRVNNIPEGARWYSGYIHRHLNYVMGDRVIEGMKNYIDEQHMPLFKFRSPRRASAFVASVERIYPGVRVDWFDKGLGYYQVVVLYASDKELQNSRQVLGM